MKGGNGMNKRLKILTIIFILLLSLITSSCGSSNNDEVIVEVGGKEYTLTVTTDEQAEEIAKEAIYETLSDPDNIFYEYCDPDQTKYENVVVNESGVFAWDVIINTALYDKQGELMCNLQYNVKVGTEEGEIRSLYESNLVWDEEWENNYYNS